MKCRLTRLLLVRKALIVVAVFLTSCAQSPTPTFRQAPVTSAVLLIHPPYRATDPLFVTAQPPLPRNPLPAEVAKVTHAFDLDRAAAFPPEY